MSVSPLLEELQELLYENGLSEFQVVSHNDNKGRWCVKACTKDGAAVFIKWDETGFMSGLSKEKMAYSLLKDTNVTPALVSDSPVFMTKYVENSCTLRHYIIQTTDEKRMMATIREALSSYVRMLEGLNTERIVLESIPFQTQLYSYCGKLLNSGPEGTSANKRTIRIRNRIIGFFLKKKLRRENPCYHETRNMAIHGDFHLNNLLVIGGGSQVAIIDFENAVYGNVTLELAYWYVQIWALLFENEGRIKELNDMISVFIGVRYFDKQIFGQVTLLYKACISMNARFQEKKMPIRKQIKAWRQVCGKVGID